MKEENAINEEVKQLLDSLEQHGRNVRRQQELSDLIDSLAAGTSTGVPASVSSLRGGTTKQSRHEATSLDCFVPRNDAKRRKLYPLWWIVGAAAACLLLWLLVKPVESETPKIEEKVLVKKTVNVEPTIQSDIDDKPHEEPVFEEKLLAEGTTEKQHSPQPQTEQVQDGLLRSARNDGRVEIAEAAEAIETHDTMNNGSNTIPTSAEAKLSTINCQLSTINCQLSTNNSSQRRVIRSLNLVCYECQKEIEEPQLSTLNSQPSTIFGQPQDPNMKNGSLAFELKLQ